MMERLGMLSTLDTRMERVGMSTLENRRSKGAVKLAEFNRTNYTDVNGQFHDAVAVADSYIARHTTVEVCNLHIDPTKISPFWPKVSTTPFDAPAKMRQGYGRQLKRSYISADAPRDSFLDPEKVVQPKNRMEDRVACVTRIPLHQDPKLPTHVLPGGLSLHQVKANTFVPHTRFRTYPHDKRTLMEPLLTERCDLKPINWGPVKQPVVLADPVAITKFKGKKAHE